MFRKLGLLRISLLEIYDPSILVFLKDLKVMRGLSLLSLVMRYRLRKDKLIILMILVIRSLILLIWKESKQSETKIYVNFC